MDPVAENYVLHAHLTDGTFAQAGEVESSFLCKPKVCTSLTGQLFTSRLYKSSIAQFSWAQSPMVVLPSHQDLRSMKHGERRKTTHRNKVRSALDDKVELLPTLIFSGVDDSSTLRNFPCLLSLEKEKQIKGKKICTPPT